MPQIKILNEKENSVIVQNHLLINYVEHLLSAWQFTWISWYKLYKKVTVQETPHRGCIAVLKTGLLV